MAFCLLSSDGLLALDPVLAVRWPCFSLRVTICCLPAIGLGLWSSPSSSNSFRRASRHTRSASSSAFIRMRSSLSRSLRTAGSSSSPSDSPSSSSAAATAAAAAAAAAAASASFTFSTSANRRMVMPLASSPMYMSRHAGSRLSSSTNLDSHQLNIFSSSQPLPSPRALSSLRHCAPTRSSILLASDGTKSAGSISTRTRGSPDTSSESSQSLTLYSATSYAEASSGA
mmetsp:Transcript_27253/g.61582  ORF Transcript_27253/g.61582 Transcript_27253/m.61582 type:complete len:228 (+) Transcript_27253:364-1047(+)